MALVFFNLKVTWPTVTNDIRVSVYNPLDLNTPIASQQQNAPHIDQQFSFPGLPRQNFVYKILETAINGVTVISQLGQASFVPADDGIEYKKPVLIEVGVSDIPGSGSTAIASTIEQNYDGNPTSSSWAFTLMGTVQEGATVEVDFEWDDGGGTQTGNVVSTVLSGWTMTDLVNDLLSQIVAINVNSLAYTDVDGFTGVRVRGLTTASGTVTITNTTGGTTPTVWPSGTNTVNVPDWIGWELEASGRPGQYPWKRDETNQLDITWDAVTGDLTLNSLGDEFQPGEFLYFEFQPIISASSGGIPPGTSGGGGFTEILLVETDTTLTSDDIGKKILIIPSGDYLEITLPDYTNIEANKFTWFEMVGSAAKCAKIITYSGQTISWLETLSDLYICPNESFELYKRVVSTGVYEWRIQNAVGNFLTAGEFFWSDLTPDKIFNAIEANGADCDYQQFARLYNRRVVRGGDGIAYASWTSGNIFTRMKFSLKDVSGNNFRIPDLNTTPVYMRPRGAGSPADFLGNQLLQHQHMQSIGDLPSPPFGQTPVTQTMVVGEYNSTGNNRLDLTSRSVSFNTATGLYEIIDGSENRPNSRASIAYIRI